MTVAKKVGCGFGLLVLALLVFVGICGFLCWQSYQRITAEAAEITDCVTELQEAAQSGDAETFAACTLRLDASVDTLRMELGSPAWDAVSLVPVYGGDIVGIRTVVRTVDHLLDNVMLPASELWVDASKVGEGIASTAGIAALTGLLTGDVANTASIDVLGSLQQGISLPDRLVSLLDTADAELAEAKATLDELPAFHIEQLNMAMEKMDKGLDYAMGLLDDVRPYADTYRSARDTVTGAVDAVTQAGSEAWSTTTSMAGQAADAVTSAAGEAMDAVGSWAAGVAEGAQGLWDKSVSTVSSILPWGSGQADPS